MDTTSPSLWEKAREVGRLLAQTDEYQALKRAHDRLAEDPDTLALLERASTLQDDLARALQEGHEPAPETEQELERLLDELQGRYSYQALMAAQSQFDRLMLRLNEEIARGLEAGEGSRIILPS